MLLSELFEETWRSNIREIDMIDIHEKWLIEKLTNSLRSSGFGQIFISHPQEGEGGSSVVATRGSQEQVLPSRKPDK